MGTKTSWKPGQSGNISGRPRKPEIQELREALQQARKHHKKDFLRHFVDRAYESDPVAIALARKIIPDLSTHAGEPEMPPVSIQFVPVRTREDVKRLRENAKRKKRRKGEG